LIKNINALLTLFQRVNEALTTLLTLYHVQYRMRKWPYRLFRHEDWATWGKIH